MENSNIFGFSNSEESMEDVFGGLNDRLVLKEYSCYLLIKRGEFLNKVIEKEEINSDVDKLLNLCSWMNLSILMSSSINNVINLALDLAAKNDNLNHLNVLLSSNLNSIVNCNSLLSEPSAVDELLTTKLPSVEEYYFLIDNLSVINYSDLVDYKPLNLIVGGTCYSKLLNLRDLSKDILVLNHDVCRDLRFVLENKHPIVLASYNELCSEVINVTKSLARQFIEFVKSIELLIESIDNCGYENDYGNTDSPSKLSNLEYLNNSKKLIDHLGYLSDIKVINDRVTNKSISRRKENFIDSRRTNLIKLDFVLNGIK